MKKAKRSSKAQTTQMTLEQVRGRKFGESELEDLRRLEVLPDEKINITDIPDLGGRKGWSRVRQDRPVTRQISIRLSDADLAEAQRLAEAKGLPYQTYIKMLLHEAIRRERAA
jgi:predicted DNA binding CopG/RHH family protein